MEGTWATKVRFDSKNTTAIKKLTVDSEDSKSESEQEKSFGPLFASFTSQTTLHGIKYSTTTKFNVFRRVIWGLLVFAMVIVFTFEFVKSTIKYLEYDVSTVINVNFVPKLDFPAVTICNYNQWRASQIGEEGELVNKLLYPLEEASRLSADQIESLFSNSLNWTDSFNLSQYAKDVAHQSENMIIDCTWQTSSICSHEDFKQVITDFGVCYTFNHNPSDVMEVQQTGSDYGLFLRLNVEQGEYTSNINTGAGFKVYLHRPSEIPLPKNLGFAISPGFEVLVGVRYTRIESLPSPYASNCKSKSLKYVETYTKGACDLECKSDYIIEHCGCRHYLLPGDAAECLGSIFFKCAESSEMLDNFTKAYTDYCDCPEPCTSNTYESKVSSAYWPSEYVANVIVETYNLTKSDIRKNYLDMLVYFEELSFEEIVQVPAFTASDYQSSIGGVLGLFLGASLITVAEFLDFMIDYIFKKIGGKSGIKGAGVKAN